jgi:hypothetical protein
MSLTSYTACVQQSLHDLVHEGRVSSSMAVRLSASALQAYHEAHSGA